LLATAVAEIISLDTNSTCAKLTIGVLYPDAVPRGSITREDWNTVKRAAFITVVAFALWGSSALAQNSNFSFNGTSQGSTYCGGQYGCVDTGFLDGSVNGVNVGPQSPGNPGMICDDYQKNLNVGQHWSASGIDVASLNSGNIGGDTLFGKNIGLQGYAAMAYLVNQMFSSNLNGSQQLAFSQALWYISGGLNWNQLNVTARALVLLATLYVDTNGDSLSQYSNLWLYASKSGGGEMWSRVSVPEGGTVAGYLLLVMTSCIAAMFVRRRSRAAQQI
jgi:hypothetical protein